MNSRWSPTRSPGARSGGSARVNFLKPPISPISGLPGDVAAPEARRTLPGRPLSNSLFGFGFAGEEAVAARRHRLIAVTLERGAVVVRHHLHEAELRLFPVVQQPCRDVGAGAPLVFLDELADEQRIRRAERFQTDELGIAALFEAAVFVENVGDTAAHARGEVAACRAEHDHG